MPAVPGVAATRQQLIDGLGAGTIVASYELVRPIAKGAAAAVFLARDLKLGRRVAIKFLVSSDEALARRFLVEAQATARCIHENIVVIHEVGSWQGLPFLVLEYLDGPALSSVLAEAPLPLSRVLELIAPVVRALGCAHRADIVHRDLKPDNIIVTRGGAVKVVDFGIAKLFQGEAREGHGESGEELAEEPGGEPGVGNDLLGGELYETLSGPGMVVGTLPYMAPEQWRGEAVDVRCDFFAVGVILHRMLTGQHPSGAVGSVGLTPRGLREMALAEQPYPSIAGVAPGLPSAAVQLVDRCLRKAPGQRPASAEELLAELEALARSSPPGRAGVGAAEACPYPGLAQFTAQEAARFFGRGREVTAALALLRRSSLLAVVGPSGSGKSSLVHAGVAPAWRAAAGGEVISLRPGRSPLQSLVEAFGAVAMESREGGAARLSAARLLAEPGALGVMLRERCHARGTSLLVIVDQFEELFTLPGRSDPSPSDEARRAFANALLGAADDVSSPIRLALTLRADFLHRVAEHGWLAQAVSEGMLLLTPPDRSTLRAALVGPLDQTGYQLEDEELADEIVAALEASAVPLPLLQLVGSRLWDHRDRQARRLSRQALRELGGVHGALAGQADDVLAGLSPAGRKLVRALLLRLVTAQGTRAVVDRADLLAMSGEAPAVLGSLVQARLVVVHEDDATVELIHEALIEQWPALRGWMLESREDAVLRDRLAGAARQWHEAGRAAGLLWTGEALADIAALRAHEVPMGAREREFAAASTAVATRAARRRRALVSGALIALAVVAVAAMVALAAVRRAERVAQEQAVLAGEEATRARAAERSLSEKIGQLEAKERERQAAEEAAAASRKIAEERRGEVARSQGELVGALAEARVAQRSAEAAAQRSKELVAQERGLRQELALALARERKRVEELRQQRSKIEQRLR
jgi:eukaryotic-like serine/threonine-protein kinase